MNKLYKAFMGIMITYGFLIAGWRPQVIVFRNSRIIFIKFVQNQEMVIQMLEFFEFVAFVEFIAFIGFIAFIEFIELNGLSMK